MARETKVGLIAGLAFIVCFAVILANRGQSRPNMPGGAPNRVATNRQPGDGGLNPRAGRESGFSTSPTTPVSTVSPNRIDRPAVTAPRAVRSDGNPSKPPSTGAEISWPEGGSTPREDHGVPSVVPSRPVAAHDDRMADASRLSAERPVGDHSLGSGTRVGDADREQLLQDLRRVESSRIVGRNVPSVGPEAHSPSATGTPTDPNVAAARAVSGSDARHVAGRRYVVQAGDSLSSIAARFYGSKSKGVVSAIVQGNRGAITDPNRLNVGVELVLPEVSSPAAKHPPPPDPAENAPRGKPTDKSDEKVARTLPRSGSVPADALPQFRWYQVKRDDRYMSIARTQLGDAARWKELYELNKDRFPDPGKIREGVRIKLPSSATTLAEARR